MSLLKLIKKVKVEAVFMKSRKFIIFMWALGVLLKKKQSSIRDQNGYEVVKTECYYGFWQRTQDAGLVAKLASNTCSPEI